ncbi:putative carbohydrate sulfotransferase 11 [Apostichopus japonicus]|uniref:Carbohydrate sulfotransferase n=1 Tax=Stichopus japonicus TaxID=307972 RepID=A0A2G8KN54_STIJA|nr:putative carbohydrate sulfotransferase 11 [Apostichopus japonicus]
MMVQRNGMGMGRNARDHHLPPNPPSQNLFLSDLRSRSNLLRQQCAKLRNELDHVQAIRNPPDGLIVDEKHKLLYCVVPKVACSSWKEFFYEIGGYGQEQTNRNKTRKLVLTYFHHLPEAKRQEIYKKLYKFVFVRHPFLRLLSAYRDKMEPNGSYERLHANKDQQSLYFWRDRLGQDIIRVYHGESEALRMKRNRNDYRITFQEFVRYLVEFPDKFYTKDRHWRPMHKLCYPCDIRYEFIANFETIDTDSAFIRRLVKADLPEKNLHATNSSNLDFAFSYYENVPKPIMRKLYERYKYDFLLFGYNPQPFL